jgi:hypothetical protein
MVVAPPGDQLRADLQEIGVVMSAEWTEAAGADGETIVNAYNDM